MCCCIPGGDREVRQSVRSGSGRQQEALPGQVFLPHESEAEGGVVHRLSAVSKAVSREIYRLLFLVWPNKQCRLSALCGSFVLQTADGVR